MGRNLIVGVDPGTTTAVAVLDLRGILLGKKSKKNFSQSELQRYILSFGQPLLFATDVVKTPTTVEKLAASFYERVEPTQKGLSRLEKSVLASAFLDKYNEKTRDFHEVSAIAAALVCYNKYENKFRQIDRRLVELGLGNMGEYIKRKVVEGISVDRALKGRP